MQLYVVRCNRGFEKTEFYMLKVILRLVLLTTLMTLIGCATLFFSDPLRVNVVGIEPLPSQGMELRFAVKLRVQNPNNNALTYDGLVLNLEVQDHNFASGVSNAQGTVPRFGESVLVIPVTLTAAAVLRQFLSLATGDLRKINYVARGKVSGTGFGNVLFESSGELALPGILGNAPLAKP